MPVLIKSPWWRGLASLALGAPGRSAPRRLGCSWLAPILCLGFFLLLRDTSSPRHAFLTGWLFGVGFFLVGVSWIYVSLSSFGGMPFWLAGLKMTLAFCATLALYPALMAAAFQRW